MSNNSNLHKAKSAKKDEFYTQLTDIENECRHYRRHFKGKTILCNCDDPFESNFFKYFAMNFESFGLKKLIATCYNGSSIAGTQMRLFEDDSVGKAYKVELTDAKGIHTIEDVERLLKKDGVVTELKGNGDFRSPECLELLDEADIVVTNPPFSLFREFVALLIEKKKKFLIIGPINAITYKEIFPLIKENKIWSGYLFGGMEFMHPDNTRQKLGNITWYTNLDIDKRHDSLVLYKRYSEIDYPKYDNYDAINVDKVSEIPEDYDGVMGVPITFLDKYCPEQFDIIGEMVSTTVDEYNYGYPYINGEKIYARILIKKR